MTKSQSSPLRDLAGLRPPLVEVAITVSLEETLPMGLVLLSAIRREIDATFTSVEDLRMPISAPALLPSDRPRLEPGVAGGAVFIHKDKSVAFSVQSDAMQLRWRPRAGEYPGFEAFQSQFMNVVRAVTGLKGGPLQCRAANVAYVKAIECPRDQTVSTFAKYYGKTLIPEPLARVKCLNELVAAWQDESQIDHRFVARYDKFRIGSPGAEGIRIIEVAGKRTETLDDGAVLLALNRTMRDRLVANLTDEAFVLWAKRENT